MINKNKIKLLSSLKIKKYREKNQLTILEGYRLIEQAINFNANINYVWLSYEAIDSNPMFIKNLNLKNISYDLIDNEDLKKISDTENSQGVIAEVDISQYSHQVDDKVRDNLVVLDGISDPGNLGTIFRTCAWYGIKSVVLTNHTADPFNFKCIRSGMGAHFYFQKIIIDSTQDIIQFLKDNNYDVMCADLKGLKISEVKTKSHWAMIFGSEAHGISLDFDNFNKVTILGKKSIDSLNVSVAAGIILDHLVNRY
tara:strand:- start:281 stop:1042 length:762 start_codon:yes stop_codon:yes gene_type:complete